MVIHFPENSCNTCLLNITHQHLVHSGYYWIIMVPN